MPKIKYVGRLYENTYRINLHTHDFWEIVRYTKGSGLVEIDGEIIPFQENDIFAIPPNVRTIPIRAFRIIITPSMMTTSTDSLI